MPRSDSQFPFPATGLVWLVLLVSAPCLIFSVAHLAFAAGHLVHGVVSEGESAVVGMTSEQSQLLALQRARSAAIERAAGIEIASVTLVTNGSLAADFIKSYTRGLIVKEQAVWLPLEQFQPSSATPPIPEYHVRLTSDVYVPERRTASVGLSARLNQSTFRSGERAVLTLSVQSPARVAIFNLTANDRVLTVFPNSYDRNNHIAANEPVAFPSPQSPVELVMQTLPDHEQDAEAFLVVAMGDGSQQRLTSLIAGGADQSLTEFFSRYAQISDQAEDVIVAYSVLASAPR
jgi:Domain of unknown function (DUF4384)